MRFYQYSESNYSTFPITLRQLPCRSNNNLAYQTNEHPFQSVVQKWFCEIFWPKKVGGFLGKCQRWLLRNLPEKGFIANVPF